MNKITKRRIWERIKPGILITLIYFGFYSSVKDTGRGVLFLSLLCLLAWFAIHTLIYSMEIAIIDGKMVVNYMNEEYYISEKN